MNQQNDSYDTRAILERMREEYWKGVTEVIVEESEDQIPLLTFILGTETFGMRAELAKEILKVPSVVRVPRTPPTVLGIINLRGKITPIIDIRPVLGLKSVAVEQAGRVIITELGNLSTGILVEEVLGITQVPREEIAAVATSIAKKDLFEGQVVIEERPLVIINMEKLLNLPDFRAATTRR